MTASPISLRPLDDDVLQTLAHTLDQRDVTREIAAASVARGLTHVCFLGVGGSWASSVPVAGMLRTDAVRFSTSNVNAAHFLSGQRGPIDSTTLVVASSHSGRTPETVASARVASDLGALVVSLARDTDNELAMAADFSLTYQSDQTITAAKYHLLEELGYSLLDAVGCDLEVEDIRRALDALPSAASRVPAAFEQRSRKAVPSIASAASVLVVGGGRMSGLAYMLAVCYLIEMQWLPAISVDSGDFLHGPLELVDPACGVIHLVGEDELRPLDDRVQRFLAAHGDAVYTIDSRWIDLPTIAAHFRGRLSHIPMALIVSRLAAHFESLTGHSLELRRYMNQVSY